MKHSANSINSFFVEMILVILFFAVSASAVLQLFWSGSVRARESGDLSMAVIKSEDMAEQLQAASSPNSLTAVFGKAAHTSSGDADHYLLLYDRQWNPVSSSPAYVMDVSLKKSPSAAGVLYTAGISVARKTSSGEAPVYKLSTAKYLPGTK